VCPFFLFFLKKKKKKKTTTLIKSTSKKGGEISKKFGPATEVNERRHPVQNLLPLTKIQCLGISEKIPK
jgi:hypothetical protein